MALIKCTECGHEVSDKASACPNCGCPINNVDADQEKTIEEESYVKEPQQNKWWIWALAAALLCLIGGGIYYLSSSKGKAVENENATASNEVEEKDVNKGKYKIVLYNDNEGEFYNPEEGRICSFSLENGRSEPMKLRLSQSLNIMGKNSDRLCLTNNRLLADYSDYLDYNSAYKPNKELGVAVEKQVTDDAVVYYMQFEKGQIEEMKRPAHQFNLNNGADYTMVYFNDEHGSMYDGKGKRICGVSKGYSSAGDLHVNLTKSVSFFGNTTKEIHIIGDKVFVSASDLIHDKYRRDGEPSPQKASVKSEDDKDATIYTFYKAIIDEVATSQHNTDPQSNTISRPQTPTDAFKDAGWRYVLSHLKSPRSATLISYAGPKEREMVEFAEKINLPGLNVAAFSVDAQNSFGAIINQVFMVFYKGTTPMHMEAAESLKGDFYVLRSVLVLAGYEDM